VSEFLPVIEVLSKTTSAFESVQEFFSAVRRWPAKRDGVRCPMLTQQRQRRCEWNQAQTDGFPVQFCFPLVPSVSATFRFDCMELQTPSRHKFKVPNTYTMQAEDMLSPRTHQAMLQRVTAT
jgi:hypothetical protein